MVERRVSERRLYFPRNSLHNKDSAQSSVTVVQQLARFVIRHSFESLSTAAARELKIRVLDSLGCALGALEAEPIGMLRAHLNDLGGAPRCTLIADGRSAPDRAALYNGALVRYLDFNDSYLAPRETCHPSDNLAAVLAGAEYAGSSGKELLTALGVAYQVQCRLSDAAPVRQKGFDHTTQGSYAAAAGVAKALRLDAGKTAHAIAISGTALNALRVTRTGRLSHWKGLAYPHTGFGATHAAFLALRGITGPEEVFEGNKGFMDAIAGKFSIDWEKEDLERVTRTILKKFNAEIHSQSALEGILELREEHGFAGEQVERIEIEIFDVAHNIIGGGEEGDKTQVRTKEDADHSLPYMVAVAALDGAVTPAQYQPARIQQKDVQSLLRKVQVSPNQAYSRRFPKEMPCRLRVHLRGGRRLEKEKADYEGFFTRPMSWERASEKFAELTRTRLDSELHNQLVAAVRDLENLQAADLTRLLAQVPNPERSNP